MLIAKSTECLMADVGCTEGSLLRGKITGTTSMAGVPKKAVIGLLKLTLGLGYLSLLLLS